MQVTKLTVKLLIVFTLATIGVLVTNTYLQVRREKQLFEADMRKDAVAHAVTLTEAVRGVLALPGGGERAAALVRRANEETPHLHLRWVALDDGAPADERPLLAPAELVGLGTDRPMSRFVTNGEHGDTLLTYLRVPDVTAGGRHTAIEVEESLEEQQLFVRGSIFRAFATSAALVLTAGVLTGAYGAAFVGRPLRNLREKARRAGAGDFSGPIHVRQRDELQDLAGDLNTMCEQLARSRQLVEEAHAAELAALEQVRRADRLAMVGQLSAGIAHEIGTPLGVIGGRAKMIASGEAVDDEARDSARIVAEQTHRIATIIRHLLDFSRKRKPEKAAFELGPWLSAGVELLGPMARKRGARLEIAGASPESLRIVGDAGQLQQALTNLVVNAIQATPRDGKVEVSLERTERTSPDAPNRAPSEWVRLSVKDDGVGMDEHILAHLFEPFFTTKDVGEGTGLGLAVTHGIVVEHGGWVDVESAPGKGSRFSVFLPLGAEARA